MSGFLHDDRLCARNSVDADGFARAVREFGRLADVLGLPDTGHSFAEIVDAAADRIKAGRNERCARLAKVEGVVAAYRRNYAPPSAHTSENVLIKGIEAALASVPEPSDSEPASKRLDARWLSFPGKRPVCRDCGADWSPVRRGECVACGSDAGPLTSDSVPAPDADREVCDDPMCGSGKHRHYGDRIEWDADREAGGE